MSPKGAQGGGLWGSLCSPGVPGGAVQCHIPRAGVSMGRSVHQGGTCGVPGVPEGCFGGVHGMSRCPGVGSVGARYSQRVFGGVRGMPGTPRAGLGLRGCHRPPCDSPCPREGGPVCPPRDAPGWAGRGRGGAGLRVTPANGSAPRAAARACALRGRSERGHRERREVPGDGRERTGNGPGDQRGTGPGDAGPRGGRRGERAPSAGMGDGGRMRGRMRGAAVGLGPALGCGTGFGV